MKKLVHSLMLMATCLIIASCNKDKDDDILVDGYSVNNVSEIVGKWRRTVASDTYYSDKIYEFSETAWVYRYENIHNSGDTIYGSYTFRNNRLYLFKGSDENDLVSIYFEDEGKEYLNISGERFKRNYYQVW